MVEGQIKESIQKWKRYLQEDLEDKGRKYNAPKELTKKLIFDYVYMYEALIEDIYKHGLSRVKSMPSYHLIAGIIEDSIDGIRYELKDKLEESFEDRLKEAILNGGLSQKSYLGVYKEYELKGLLKRLKGIGVINGKDANQIINDEEKVDAIFKEHIRLATEKENITKESFIDIIEERKSDKEIYEMEGIETLKGVKYGHEYISTLEGFDQQGIQAIVEVCSDKIDEYVNIKGENLGIKVTYENILRSILKGEYYDTSGSYVNWIKGYYGEVIPSLKETKYPITVFNKEDDDVLISIVKGVYRESEEGKKIQERVTKAVNNRWYQIGVKKYLSFLIRDTSELRRYGVSRDKDNYALNCIYRAIDKQIAEEIKEQVDESPYKVIESHVLNYMGQRYKEAQHYIKPEGNEYKNFYEFAQVYKDKSLNDARITRLERLLKDEKYSFKEIKGKMFIYKLQNSYEKLSGVKVKGYGELSKYTQEPRVLQIVIGGVTYFLTTNGILMYKDKKFQLIAEYNKEAGGILDWWFKDKTKVFYKFCNHLIKEHKLTEKEIKDLEMLRELLWTAFNRKKAIR